ncbi:MAG: fibronectin type III domain-containing protein, partial [Opitutaceae bacterium]|nr:fibronectin type III domain-containing protein [Cytophagales bacterium]
VLYPQEPYGQWTNSPYFANSPQLTSALSQVHDVIDSLIKNYRVDPTRIVIHGLSSGGTGTWASLYHRPDLFAAALPMSTPGDMSQMGKVVNIPIWLFQGGLDNNPIPYISQQVIKALRDSGAVDTDITRYTEYANIGHGVWSTAYAEPDFFPYINRARKNKIMVLAKNPFCPGTTAALGFSEGFYNYQWYKGDTLIPGVASNKLRNITVNGNYSLKYKISPTSSVSSSNSVYVYKDVAAPKPVVTASQSLIVPSPSGSNLVLTGPAGFNLYQWSNGVTTQQNTISNSGSYSLKVKQTTGCISVSSDTFAVKVGSMGTPPPSMATNIKAIPISPDSVLVSWNNVSDETGYEIYRSNLANSGYVFVKLVSANTVSFTDFGLNPSTGYYYKIRSVNKVAATLSSEKAYVETFKDVTLPTIPQNLSMYNLTPSGQITLLWNKSTDKYALKRYAVYSGNVVLGSTTDTTISINLNKNEVYMFSVEAEDYSGNKSGKSNIVPFAYNGAGLYANFYIKKDPNDPWNKLPDFTQLTPDRQVVINTLGSLSGSTLTPLLTDGGSPVVLSALNNKNIISVVDYFALRISGFIKTGGSSGTYTFYNTSDDGARLTINNSVIINRNAPQGPVETSGTISLNANTWYPFVYEFFEAGGGQYLALTWKTPGASKSTIPAGNLNYFGADPTASNTPPVTNNFTGMSMPVEIVSTSTKKVSLTVNFSSAPDPTVKSLEFYRIKATSISTSSVFSKIGTIVRNGNSSAITYIDSTNLLPSTQYFYALKIFSETGFSIVHFTNAYLNGAGGDRFLTISSTAITAPTIVPTLQTVSGISNSIIRLGFIDNSCPNESGFEIWKSQDPTKYFTKIGFAPRNATGYDDSTGVINTTYYYKLKAYNQAGASAFSNIVSGVTLNIPNAPSNLKVVVLGPKHVNLTWQNNSVSSGYGFSIYKSTSKNGVYFRVDSIANPGLTFYQDSSAALTQKYYYKVRAYNDNKSAFSNIDSSSIYQPVTPSALSWKMPVQDVTNNFRSYSGSVFTPYTNNIGKLKTNLVAKKDFLKYLYIEKNDSSNFSIQLPTASGMTYGGIITFNIMSVKNLTPDTAKIADEFFDFKNDGDGYNQYKIKVSSSPDNVTFTALNPSPWFSRYSNQLQKIDIPASLAGNWIKVEIVSQSNKGTYGGILVTEIGAYSLLGPGVRHNYFLLEGASVEKTNIPLGMIQFRKQLATISDLSAYASEALIFNLSTPGVASKYLKDSINTDLSRHPYATCVIVHQGGNDVNSSTNGVRPLTYSKLSSLPAAKNLIDNFTFIIQAIQSSGKLALISRMHFRDYKDYCPGTTRIAAFVNPSPPAALRGRSQENGSLPINLLIDSLTKTLTPYAYNFAEKRSSVNYYPIFLNRQKMLGPDGIHPSSVPFNNVYSNPYVDIMTNYYINYALRYVYTGRFSNPEDYDASNQLIAVGPTDTICALLPANKPNLLALTKTAVEKAEQTKSGNDIWEARILVEQMRNADGRVTYVNRLDSLKDYRSPANPTSLAASVVDGSTISLTWLDNDVIETGYQVYKSEDNGLTYNMVALLPANSSQYNVTGLTGAILYTFYVKAINGKFNSGWTNLVTARPGVTYYSSATGIITNTTTWGRQNDGSGSNPTNFYTGSQVYVFANRPNETVLNLNWDVTGNYSKIVLSQGTKFKISKGVVLNGILELGPGSQLNVKSDSVPVLSFIDSLSTLVLSGKSKLRNKNYGTLKLDSTGLKTLVNDTVNIKGNLILESGVTLKGKPTVIKLSGDLILNDSLPVFENITLVLLKKSHLIDTKAGDLSLNSLVYSDTSTITLLNGSQLKLGSVSGGGLLPGQNSTINIGSGLLSIEGNGALNPLNKTARISSYLGIININTTSSLDSYIYPSISSFNFKDITANINVGRTIFLKDSLKLSNTLKLKSGTFNTGNFLILASDIYGTARIAKVEANATLTGDIKWQRLIGPFKKLSYYYIGTPIKSTKAAILDKYFTILGFQPNQISTLASYNEQIGKWNGIKDSNTVLAMGIGYRALLRNEDIIYSDSSGFLEISGPPMVGNGSSNTGTLNIPVTKNNIGWNVVSNPYPCEIDWKAITAISPDVEDAFYMWDGAKKTYRVYKGPGGTGAPRVATLGMSPIINSGQGFVVKAKNNGTLNINENAKRSDTIQPVFYREASYPFLRINLRNDEYQADEAILRFYEDATKNFDDEYDAIKYVGNYQNISTIAGSDNLTINTLPYYAKNLSVPVYVQAYYNGNFYLDFSEMESFPPDIDIYLKDNTLGTLTDIKKNFSYQFSATALDTKTRFEVVFNNLPSALVTNYETNNMVSNNLTVHPNPAEHATAFNVMLESAGLINLEVLNLNGQMVYNSEIAGHYGENKIDWSIEKDKIVAGIYYYKVNTNGKDYTGKLVIQ